MRCYYAKECKHSDIVENTNFEFEQLGFHADFSICSYCDFGQITNLTNPHSTPPPNCDV